MVSNADRERIEAAALPLNAGRLSSTQKAYLIEKARLPESITRDPHRLTAQLNYLIRMHNTEIEGHERRRNMNNAIENALQFNPVSLLAYSPIYLHSVTGRIVTPVISADGLVSAHTIECGADGARNEQERWMRDDGGKLFSMSNRKQIRLDPEELMRVTKNRGLSLNAHGFYE